MSTWINHAAAQPHQAPTVISEWKKVTGLRALRATAQVEVTATIVLPLAKPEYPTGRNRHPTRTRVGEKMYVEAKVLPSPLPHAENTTWHCRCTRVGIGPTPDATIPCAFGASFTSLEALRNAHPSNKKLETASEIHVYFAIREIPGDDGAPAQIDVFTTDGADLDS